MWMCAHFLHDKGRQSSRRKPYFVHNSVRTTYSAKAKEAKLTVCGSEVTRMRNTELNFVSWAQQVQLFDKFPVARIGRVTIVALALFQRPLMFRGYSTLI